jgi:sugar lactone lactonase YvrE
MMFKFTGLGLGLVFLLAFQWSCGSKSSSPTTPSGGGGTTYTYPFKFSFGGTGSGSGQFSGPRAVAIYNDALFVSDYSNERVEKFDLEGNYLGQWSGHTAFDSVAGITFNKTGTLYVSSLLNGTIQTADLNFNYENTYGPAVGGYTLSHPFGLAVDNNGVSILVADSLAGAVYRFNSTFSAGVSVAFSFSSPFQAAEDSSGNLYVVDTSGNDIVKFNSSLAAGTTIAGSGTTNGLVSLPTSIAVDSDGNLLVGDLTGRLQKLSPSGSYITQISGPGSNPGQFGTNGLFVTTDANKNIYVADYANNVVDVFAPN